VTNLTIVIPSYNKKTQILATINAIVKILNENMISYSMIVVDDGSTDGTISELNKVENSFVKVISLKENLGKGNALKVGFNKVETELCAFFDADMDLNPKIIIDSFNLLNINSTIDFIMGSKLHRDSIINYPKVRKIMSFSFYMHNKLLFPKMGVQDTQTGFKMFRVHRMKEIVSKIYSDGFAFDFELVLMASLNNLKIKEIPIQMNYHFNSTVNIRNIGITFWEIYKIFIRNFLKN
jgi:glycosyltransferase involved in cell wall biosynthesis